MSVLPTVFQKLFLLCFGLGLIIHGVVCFEPEYLESGSESVATSKAPDTTTRSPEPYQSGSEYIPRRNVGRRRPSESQDGKDSRGYERYDQRRLSSEGTSASASHVDINAQCSPASCASFKTKFELWETEAQKLLFFESSRPYPPRVASEASGLYRAEADATDHYGPQGPSKDQGNSTTETPLGLPRAMNIVRNRDVFEDSNHAGRSGKSPRDPAVEAPWSPARHRSWKVRHMQAQRDMYHSARSSAQSSAFV